MTIQARHKTTQKPPQPDFKLTELGWIPNDWEVDKVDNIFQLLKTSSFSRKDLNYEKGNIKYIHYGDIHSTFENALLNVSSSEEIPFLNNTNSIDKKFDYLKSGDLIIADASEDFEGVGKAIEVCKVNEKIISGLHTFALRDKLGITSKGFRAYLFSSEFVRRRFKQVATGTKVYGISKHNLNKILVPLPPLPEQQAIADCLSTWDEAIEKQSQLIKAKQEQHKGLRQLLLTGKKRLTNPETGKVFDGEWMEKRLKKLVDFRNGKGHEKVIVEDGEFIVVNSKFISTNGNIKKYTNKNLSPLYKDEIVMVMSDIPNGKAIAKCFYIEENNKYTLNQRICSLKANDNINSRFLYYKLNRNRYYLKFDDGVSQTNLRKNEVLDCPLKLPSLKEQTAIAEVLETSSNEIELLQEQLHQLQLQKKGLMQMLLSGEKRLVG